MTGFTRGVRKPPRSHATVFWGTLKSFQLLLQKYKFLSKKFKPIANFLILPASEHLTRG